MTQDCNVRSAPLEVCNTPKVGEGDREESWRLAPTSFQPVRHGRTGDWQQRAMLVCAQAERSTVGRLHSVVVMLFEGRGLVNSVLLSNIG